jgi:uncharacterized protein YjiS (DUF1127 family)
MIATSSQAAPLGQPAVAPLEAVRRFAGGRVAAFRRWRQTRRLLEEIATLDDAMLRDLGVSRWQLHDHIRFGDR